MEGKVFLRKYLIWTILLLGQLHGSKSCVEKERTALLELKQYLISISREDEVDSFLPTWTYDTKSDCCIWEGVKCNRTTQRVTEIAFKTSHSKRSLKENFLLNLSLFHPFEDVRCLNLSFNYFNGLFDDVEGYKSLGRLRNLEILDLNLNQFNNSIFPFVNAATSLTTLSLFGNRFNGPFPDKELKDLTNLQVLDLCANRFNGSLSVQVSPALKKLKALDLSVNEFSASTGLQVICEMKNMQELNLRRNKLLGQFPLCLTVLTGLRFLDLSSNQFTGKVPSSLGNLGSLKHLSLLDNNFEGLFSFGLLANLSELRIFKIGSKSKSFQVDSKSYWKPNFQLSVVELQSCNLFKVPNFLLNQRSLSIIDLSDNRIYGVFPYWLLANNTKLKVLSLKNNSLTSFQLPESAHNLGFLDVSANDFNHLLPEDIGWVLPHLMYINIANNGFHGYLPSSLGNMKEISYLNLAQNSFHGKLPRSFEMGCYSMGILILSHNKLSGEVFPESVNFTGILELYMDNNLFTGKIGQGLRNFKNLQLLDISNNNLTGVVPSWIGEFTSLRVLLLSKALLEGEVPISLFNLSYLELLDLSSNTLSGGIPSHVNSRRPVVLLLQDNKLSGVIPDTLLRNVSILDLGNNRLSGNIPEFTYTRYTLTILLRGNNLTGSIPLQLCGLKNIQHLDLANNRLSGPIPSCFSNTSFVLGIEDIYCGMSIIDLFSFLLSLQSHMRVEIEDHVYLRSPVLLDQFGMISDRSATQIKIAFSTKHRYDTYHLGGNLRLLFGMDLSENQLSGNIPAELGGLLELKALNLSHNNLSGLIPESFSGLKKVESLDLSFNKLQGRIPLQLTALSSLAVFNVSFNNLSGVIPQGKQFNTFGTPSYLGNPLLCGKPTNTSCSSSNFQEPGDGVESADESIVDMVSFYWSLAAAYVTILLGILFSLSFRSPWRRFWFYLVDAFIHKAKSLLW
ncbi:receptor-like protein 15 [Raphanus sativus]|uniref:Receptor-like protein 15 n=1 Tax=Raphanus sativus TaxID=3726 RepID=A0A6J0K9X1_RAPSA|nr:receptor-like protein 15 [Raphanus sativus]